MRFRHLGLVACIFCALPAVQAATILSENFNELTDALSATSVGAFQAIGGTNVDIVGPGNGFAALCATIYWFCAAIFFASCSLMTSRLKLAPFCIGGNSSAL